MWLAAAAEPYNLYTNEIIFNALFAPHMKPTTDHAESDAIMKSVASEVENGNTPVLILCPRLRNEPRKLWPYRLPPAGAVAGQLWQVAADQPSALHHRDVAELFSLVVNSGSTTDYNAASTRFRQMFGEGAKTDNAGYFLFVNQNSSSFEAKSGWQKRFQGPDFNFMDAFAKQRIVPLAEDPYVKNWIMLMAHMQGATEAEVELAQQFIYVSHSPKICWNLLLQGLQEHATPNTNPVAIQAEPEDTNSATAVIWKDECIHRCGPNEHTTGEACAGRVDCKMKCLRDLSCVGFYLNSDGGLLMRNAPFEEELANHAGQYHEFLALNRRSTGSGLAFNSKASYPLQQVNVPMYVYKEMACGENKQLVATGCDMESFMDAASSQLAYANMEHACTNFTAPERLPVHNTLASCKKSGAQVCATGAKFVHQLRNGEWIENCTRQYRRINEHDPAACRNKCFTNMDCMAWTWNKDVCEHTTSVGQLTTSSVPADLQVLRELGFDPARNCSGQADHAFDMCMGRCVHIGNSIHQGWCVHNWVNCKDGPYVTTGVPPEVRGESICTGGFHPEDSNLDGEAMAKTRDAGQDPTWREQNGVEFLRSAGYLYNRKNVNIGTRQGAYTADQCGNIGASEIHKDNFTAWRTWSTEELNTNTEQRMSSFYPPRSWTTRTFVTPSQGSADSMDGNAYASTTAGVNSAGDGLKNTITFPKCQFLAGTNGRVYSYTRGNKCSNTVNSNAQAFYDKSVAAIPNSRGSMGPSGSPFLESKRGVPGNSDLQVSHAPGYEIVVGLTDWGQNEETDGDRDSCNYWYGRCSNRRRADSHRRRAGRHAGLLIEDPDNNKRSKSLLCFSGAGGDENGASGTAHHTPWFPHERAYIRADDYDVQVLTACADSARLARIRNPRYERAYGDNEHCYMTMEQATRYAHVTDTPTAVTGPYEWKQNIVCESLPMDIINPSTTHILFGTTWQTNTDFKAQCYSACKAWCNDPNNSAHKKHCKYCAYTGPEFNVHTSSNGVDKDIVYGLKCQLHETCKSPSKHTAQAVYIGNDNRRRRAETYTPAPPIPPAGYTWVAILGQQATSAPEGATLHDLQEDGALLAESVAGLHPAKGYIQNAQRAFADQGSLRQSVTYDPPPGNIYRKPSVRFCALDFENPTEYPSKLIVTDTPFEVRQRWPSYGIPTADHGLPDTQCKEFLMTYCTPANEAVRDQYAAHGHDVVDCTNIIGFYIGDFHLVDGRGLADYECHFVTRYSTFTASRGPDHDSSDRQHRLTKLGNNDWAKSLFTEEQLYRWTHTLFQFECRDTVRYPTLDDIWDPGAAVYTRNAIPSDGPTWKAYLATRSTLSSHGNVLPNAHGSDFDYNAGNAGMMCPIGVYHGKNPDRTILNMGTDEKKDWHPYAQTTLKCPANKPVRCSKLTIVSPAGGTCEYSSEAGEARHPWSGNKPIEDKDEYDAMEKWKSKLGRNTQCHVYDFSCHSIEDDIATSVCGFDGPGDTPLGGARCGMDSVDDGWCGWHEGTATEPESRFTSNQAAQLCKERPTGQRTVCPSGMALVWSELGEALCAPAVRAEKTSGPARTGLSPTLGVQSDTTAEGDLYYLSSNCPDVATNTGECIGQACSPRSRATCDAQDLKSGKSSCTWTGTGCESAGIVATKGDPTMWWPGFNAVNGSYAGVGPGWAGKMDKCNSVDNSCKGFNMCGDTSQMSADTCLSDLSAKCCHRDGAQFTASEDTCQVSPTTKCGGGMFLYSYDDTRHIQAPTVDCPGPDDTFSIDGYCPKSTPYVFSPGGQRDSACCSSIPRVGDNLQEFYGLTTGELKVICGGTVRIPYTGYPQFLIPGMPPFLKDHTDLAIRDNKQMCYCDCHTCQAKTNITYSQSKLEISASQDAGYLATVQELFLQLTDKETGNPMRAQGCRGPADRLEGALWSGMNPSCACADEPIIHTTDARVYYVKMGVASESDCINDRDCSAHHTDSFHLLYAHARPDAQLPVLAGVYAKKVSAQRRYLCDATTSCAYTQARPGTHGFTVGGAAILNDFYIYNDDVECRSMDVEMAQMWCISEGDSCTRLARRKSDGQFCLLGKEHEHSANPVPFDMWTRTGCSTNPTMVVGSTALQIHEYCVAALSDPTKALQCCGSETCGDTLVCELQEDHVYDEVYDLLATRHSTDLAYEWTFGVASVGPVELIASYEPFEADGVLAACASDVACLYTGWSTDGKMHTFKDGDTPTTLAMTAWAVKGDAKSELACPARLECVHGTSVFSSAGTCTCRCHEFFRGALCDQCTSANREEDCRTCKENYVMGFNDVCICKAGFDVATGCTKCLPGFHGAHCQTDMCAYTLKETVGAQAYNLDNIVIAYSDTHMLYDGIVAAGDGRIPFSMQNTYVRQNDKLYWLTEDTRVPIEGPPLNTALEPIVHQLTGEWLYSIPAGASQTIAALMNSESTWGYVCRYTPETDNLLQADASGSIVDCAAMCTSNVDCGSWHWDDRRAESRCMYYEIARMLTPNAIPELQQFSASEFSVSMIHCRSGGQFGAGKLRNLPNVPSLAVPAASNMLQSNPTWLRGTVVCAFGESTPFMLSQYRRHAWGSGPCSRRVQFTWLYSMPRGKPMDKATVRYEWKYGHDLTTTYHTDTTITANGAQDCGAKCNATDTCYTWFHDNTICGHISEQEVGVTQSFAVDTWGGQAPVEDPATGTGMIVRGPGTVAVPEKPVVTATVHSEQQCCHMCESYQAWQLAGARCSCYDGGSRPGTVTDCWEPTVLAEGDTCSTLIEMEEHPGYGIRAGDGCISVQLPFVAPTSCAEACVEDPTCNVAVRDGEQCHLYRCDTHVLTANSAVHTSVKMGGCIQVDNECVRGTRFATPGGACSAGGAHVAFNANARLYYGDDKEPDTVPLTPGPNCDGDFYPMLVGNGRSILQVADVELMFHRWKEWPRTLGVLQTADRMREDTPTSATPGVQVDGVVSVQGRGDGKMRMHAGIGVADNGGPEYQFTQSFAIVSKDDTCRRQAQLAAAMIGIKQQSSHQGRCSELGCVHTVSHTGTLETVQAAYLQQMEACGNTSMSTDNAEPVSVLLYLQPPAPWTITDYVGLPVYQIPAGDAYATTFGSRELPPSPTAPAPAVQWDTPSPTPSKFAHVANITCTAKEHCCFKQWDGAPPLAMEQASLEIPGAPYGADNTTLLGCRDLCAKLLLCRVASYTGTACQMWSVPIAGRQQQRDTPFHVAPVEDGCTPSATLEAGLVGDAKTLVKQDCCLHTILS